MPDFAPFYLTLKLAGTTTALLLLIGIPLAYWLSFRRSVPKVIIEALVALPMVLPPSVMGFYLLVAFSPANAFGEFMDRYLDTRLVFTFPGLVVASVLYSLPFMVQPIQSGFRMLPEAWLEASYTLGKGRWTTLRKVILPNCKTAVLTGCILSFAHTVGEFGVVLMIGGNIPDETRVISVAIYDEVQAMNYVHANLYSAILLGFSFTVLVSVQLLNYRAAKRNRS